MQAIVSAPSVPTGKIKSFGAFGPRYEIGHAVGTSQSGEWMIEITLVDSGEKAQYPFTQMQADPEAA